MKKLLLFFVLGSIYTVSHAQVNFGAKAGLNLANLSMKTDIEEIGDNDNKMKVGFNVGAFADISVSESFSLRPEAVFSLQGAAGEDKSKLNLSYVNIPVLGKYTSEGGFFAETGPQVGFLMSAKVKDDEGSEDIKELYKGIDFPWAFGVGYNITEAIGVNGRYNLGLSNIFDTDYLTVKNNVIQVGLFYNFGGASASR